jgi:uncharacterized protein (DUF2252 family)
VAAADRPDPIDLLERQAKTRVPELVPIRYGRMLVSPFAFYRGAALVMASDLAATPQSGLRVQLCGDAHLSNFGVFASPDRRLMFDLNDFDETLPGPWEWDVKRLAASLAVAAREREFGAKQRERIVAGAVRAYREAMREFSALENLAVWYARLDTERLLADYGANVDRKLTKRAEKNLAKARTRDSTKAFEKLTTIVDGEPRIASDPPLIVPVQELVEGADREQTVDSIRGLLRAYASSLQPDRQALFEQYRFVDMARKVVGVGSVGTRAWIVLMFGRDGGDPLFLQAKEAQASVLEEFAGPSHYRNSGKRVVVGQWLMQAASDILLGWERATGIDRVERDFYVRQLKDWKGSAEIETMLPAAMEIYGRMCGWTLARAHARSGDRIAIASYLGKSDAFDRALVQFAEDYADQNERDYRALQEAVASGRLAAETGL